MRQVPRMLFHYTSAAGLLGILKSGVVWATDTRFTNDSREVQFGLDRLMPALVREVAQRQKLRAFSHGLELMIDEVKNDALFISCFCEEGDLLSQWRGYASPGGYAIGFAPEVLLGRRPEHGNMLPVYYGRSERAVEIAVGGWAQQAADGFEALVDAELNRRNAEAPEGESAAELPLARILSHFNVQHLAPVKQMCTLLKDPSFSEEREWRIVRRRWSPDSYPVHLAPDQPPLLFREGPLGMAPYVEVDLAGDDGLLPIREVVVGPGPQAELRLLGVRLLLDELGYEDVAVRPSAVPYRG